MGVAHNDPFSVQINWVQKNNFEEVLPAFFRTAGLQHKLLILIVSSNIFYQKPAKESKVDVVFALGQNLFQIRSNCKKNKGTVISMFFHILLEVYIYKQIEVFTLVSQSLSHTY